LTDVFGVQLYNNQRIADDFARNGFKVVMIDMFNGDPIPADALTGGAPGFDREKWSQRHGIETVEPLVKRAYNALAQEGVTKFYLNGYCYGARVAFDLAFEGFAHTITVSHPSRLVVPDDFEKYKSMSKAPLLINSCEIDHAFDIDAQSKADEIMAGFAPGYRRTYWEGCTHGFAVRGDLDNPKVKAGKEGAFQATVLWFLEHK